MHMKDIIREAVARAEAEQRPMVRPTAQALMQQHASSGVTSNFARDGELEKVMASLMTRIKVVGCGGAGSNTIARCTEEDLGEVELIACNTDAQHLLMAKSPHKILIGRHLTRGL